MVCGSITCPTASAPAPDTPALHEEMRLRRMTNIPGAGGARRVSPSARCRLTTSVPHLGAGREPPVHQLGASGVVSCGVPAGLSQ